MAINRKKFFDNFPKPVLGKALTADRKDGFNAIFDAWEKEAGDLDIGGLAYAFATAWHETGATMQPVREGFAKSDASAIKVVTDYCAKQGIANYAAPDSKTGKSYFGRGYVQLTHAGNYKKMGTRLGVGEALYKDPGKVMEPKTGAQILVLGMVEGLFRPAAGKLKKYFTPTTLEWFDARELINGDKNKKPKWANGKKIGQLVADYGKAFYGALLVASKP